MNRETFIEECRKLNLEVTDVILDKVDKYIKFLLEYNKHTNLTSITDINDIYLKHFYDSLTITKVIDLNNVNNLLDIGTGAGFPGMVLKIFFPNLNVTLLDSNNKKTTFLKELSNHLDIKVEIINDRVENYSKDNLNKYDVVTSRAVANLRVLSELSIPLVKVDGYFIPMKASVDEELKDSIETIEILNSKLISRVEFNVYNNEGLRNILLIKNTKDFKKENLRTYDKILKKPLKKNCK